MNNLFLIYKVGFFLYGIYVYKLSKDKYIDGLSMVMMAFAAAIVWPIMVILDLLFYIDKRMLD